MKIGTITAPYMPRDAQETRQVIFTINRRSWTDGVVAQKRGRLVSNPDETEPGALELKPSLSQKGFTVFTKVVLISATLAVGNPPNPIHLDFRKDSTVPNTMKYVGKKAPEVIQSRPGGVLFDLPADNGGVGPVGIAPLDPVKGDFETTVWFGVLEEAKPARESSGLNLHIYIDTPKRGATITRSHKPDGKIYLFTHHLTRTPGQETKHVFHHEEASTPCKSGKLKLKRVGSKLSYWAAEGTNTEFRILHQVDWDTDDVRLLRIAGTNAKSSTPFKFRILEWEIKPPDMPTSSINTNDEQQETSFPWFLVFVFVGLVILVGLVAGLFIWNRSSQSDEEEEDEEEEDEED